MMVLLIVLLILILGTVFIIAHYNSQKKDLSGSKASKSIQLQGQPLDQENWEEEKSQTIKDYAVDSIGKRHSEAATTAKSSIEKMTKNWGEIAKMQEAMSQTTSELEKMINKGDINGNRDSNT